MVDTVGQVDYILKQSQKTRSIGTVTFAWILLISNFWRREQRRNHVLPGEWDGRGALSVYQNVLGDPRFIQRNALYINQLKMTVASVCLLLAELGSQTWIGSFIYIIHTKLSRKRSFSETLFKSEKFKNAAFRFKVGGLDFVELFENDDLTWFPRSSFPRTQIHNDCWLSRFQFSQA